MKKTSELHGRQSTYILQKPPTRLNDWTSWATECVAVGASTAASLVMSEYQRAVMAQQSRAEQRWSSRMVPNFVLESLFSHEKGSSESRQSQPHRHLAIIPEPGPVHFVCACLVYSTAINVLYHIHKRDRYQLGIVACGVLGALAAGWASKQDTKDVITGLGTWAVMASLLLSAAFHKLLRDHGEEARMSL
ncbi:hypothetical protein PSV08DRAFT_23112 [Bipolaris maydis]|uniref:uncharacterized protein n=1 Tax=Cochliobolus heterostrophus TaxID=5016 RepID=UPI0024D88C05|nr:hypothetical protein PSV08DRAFT_23112 [Bipolaris maydis]KAJ6286409.1 hypothetical protein J3E71DRAFT_25251 [Bipolaris maydis]